jgi:hypothetical protein
MEKHWSGFLDAIGANSNIPMSSMVDAHPVALYPTSDSSRGRTGFQDIRVKKPGIQARYDAMSGAFEGVEAADKAVTNGLFKTEAMPIDKTLPQYSSK